jgi:diguanylate cyclase (GGDEF)-like protein
MRSRFQNKIIALIISVVLVAQLATFLVVNIATERSVRLQLGSDLRTGERVWQRFHENRSNQLLESVSVLADDFGFKGAVASGDRPTIDSALRNQSSRIGADTAVLLTPEGEALDSLLPGDAHAHALALRPLVLRARKEGYDTSVVELDGRLFDVALVPVMAPNTIAWVAVGTPVDSPYAEDYRLLTGLDASFARVENGTLNVYASSLPAPALAALRRVPADAMSASHLDKTQVLSLQGSQYFVLAERLSGNGSAPVQVLLQGSLDRAMAPYASLRQTILLLSAVAGLLALVIAIFIGRGVSKPVADLAQAAQRIQQGDYSQPVAVRGNDEISGLAGAFQHMQQGIAEREQQVRYQASHDGLTGLPNRARAIEALEAVISRRAQSGGCCAVLVLDLNRFKEINDTLGHGFGDQVLVEVAKRLQLAVRQDDLVARLGGDEFLVLMERVEPDYAPGRATGLLQYLRTPLDLPATRINLDASLGLVLYPEHGNDAQTLLRRADIALYEAKASRQGVVVYQPGHDETHLHQLTLMSELRRSIERSELSLKFQPKIELSSGKVLHAEALLRWNHPTLGAVRPDEFIPLAEQSGFIRDISRYVLEESLRQNRAWLAAGLDIGVAVNLSAMDLMDADLADFIYARLAQHKVPPSQLILELTESALMGDVNYAIRMLLRLRAGGVRIAIDDFGTGYSSLAQLKRMPVDELKIDKSFVMQMTEGSDDAVIVRSTIELGHNMGLKVIAEGVENEQSLALLRKYGCDMVQGYFYSPPIGADELFDWHRSFTAA